MLSFAVIIKYLIPVKFMSGVNASVLLKRLTLMFSAKPDEYSILSPSASVQYSSRLICDSVFFKMLTKGRLQTGAAFSVILEMFIKVRFVLMLSVMFIDRFISVLLSGTT